MGFKPYFFCVRAGTDCVPVCTYCVPLGSDCMPVGTDCVLTGTGCVPAGTGCVLTGTGLCRSVPVVCRPVPIVCRPVLIVCRPVPILSPESDNLSLKWGVRQNSCSEQLLMYWYWYWYWYRRQYGDSHQLMLLKTMYRPTQVEISTFLFKQRLIAHADSTLHAISTHSLCLGYFAMRRKFKETRESYD